MHTHTGHFINTSVQYNMTTLSWVQLLPVYIVRQVINVIHLAGEFYLSGLLCVFERFRYFVPVMYGNRLVKIL